jgi:mRNA-degrading endonuclease RelE of RelBE toxin-antitoxin system
VANLYRLEWERRVRRQLQDLPDPIRQDAIQSILDLREDPYTTDSESLHRELADLRRIKIDGWRIHYKVVTTQPLPNVRLSMGNQVIQV